LVVVQNSTGDTSQNGIWVMNTDGSQPIKVLSVPAGQSISLSPTHSSSGAGDLYAASIENRDGMTLSLIYGSTSSANATSFFTLSTSVGYPGLVGWVTA
jgi:hypothetical protein